jgi:phosphatidylserine/phosphatidylglycerophosphate/cardiolipin synthase-like enzyme
MSLDLEQENSKWLTATWQSQITSQGPIVQNEKGKSMTAQEFQTIYFRHHKFALFDNARLLTGSYNWTRSAPEHNHENFVVTNSRKLVMA